MQAESWCYHKQHHNKVIYNDINYQIAYIYAHLGNKDKCLEYLNKIDQDWFDTSNNAFYSFLNNSESNTLELFNDLMENHYQEIIKPGPKTALISSIVKNPKYKSINPQYMADMFVIIKCGYGIQAL